MFFNYALVLAAAISSTALLGVQAHGTITGVTGANGVQGAGFGIIASTPRDGTRAKPFQQDTSIIRDNEISSGETGVCGRTKAGGNNDVASQLAAASAAGLPSAAADGSVTMTLHQVNGDGAGPYTCDVSGDGGNTFQAAIVTTQVPGKRGNSRAKAQDFALVAQMPVGMVCTAGPNGDACIMRCRNPARAGPFGSCVAVTSGDAATAATTNTTVAAAAASGTEVAAAAGTSAAAAAAAGTVSAAAAETSAAAAAETSADDDEEEEDTPTAAAGTGAGSALAAVADKLKLVKIPKRHIVSRIAGKRSGYWLDDYRQ